MESAVKYISIIFLLIICTLKVNAQMKDRIKIENELIKISQEISDAIPAGDKAVWEKYLMDSSFVISEEGNVNTKAYIISQTNPLPKGFSGNIKVTRPTFAFYTNTVVMNFISKEYENVFGQEIHTEYSMCETFVKTQEGWRILTLQVFEIPQHPEPVEVDSTILKKYLGVYQLGDSRLYEVTMKEGKLFINRKDKPKEELFAENENTFFTNSDTRGVKIFVKDKTGGYNLIARRNGKDIIWKKIK
jgi:Domain of unknown function (DUF4440)